MEVISLKTGERLSVHYMDHSAEMELEKSVPCENNALGFFVKTAKTDNGYAYMVLAADFSLGAPLHPYSIILWNDIVSIFKIVEQKRYS